MTTHGTEPVSTAASTSSLTARTITGFRRGLLRVPLMAKLVGANLLVAAAVSLAFGTWEGRDLLVLGGLTLAVSLGLSTLLIRIALGPLDQLEEVARQVAAGETAQRVDSSSVEDHRFEELRESFNRLLHQVEQDRTRIRQLARLSLEVREAERAALADTLRDATAQEMAALSMRLGAASAGNRDPLVAEHIEAAREIARGITEEVGAMADSVFPGLLGELGLPAALEALGRRVAERSAIEVTVDASGLRHPLPLSLAKVFFRVAEEAVRNTEVHARANWLRLSLQSDAGTVHLRVEDDGAGFDAAFVEHGSVGVGLFRARELLARSGGQLQVTTAPGQGATIVATAPITGDAP